MRRAWGVFAEAFARALEGKCGKKWVAFFRMSKKSLRIMNAHFSKIVKIVNESSKDLSKT